VLVGDLVRFRASRHTSEFKEYIHDVGLIVELQARGPVPGAYVLWSSSEKTEWIKIENLISVEKGISQ